MLSPTSQTAVDQQSRSSFPLSLSLFIYLSQVPSCSHWGLSISCPPSTPLTLSISWPIHSHPVILFFYLNPSVLHISSPVHYSAPDQKTSLYHFPSPSMEMEIVIFIHTIKIMYLPPFRCTVFFFSQYSNAMENREWNCVSKTKISNTDVLRFSQSLTGCCYFKILSLHCKFCCLWQIYRLSKTTTPFKISYRKS